MNVDFSSITGNINYDATSVMTMQVLMFAMGLMAILLIISWIFGKSRSKEYRELMTDMLVVGVIKNIAKEKNVDLIKELKEYATIEKKSRLRLKGLDEVVEAELNEEVARVNEEQIK